MCNAAGDVQPPEQTSGKLFRTEFAKLPQPDEIDGLADQLYATLAITHIQRAEIIDILLHGEFVEHRHVLWNDADATFQIIAGGSQFLSEYANGTLAIGKQGKDAIDRSGLARTVGSQQAEDLALMHVKIEVVEREHIAISFDQPLHAYRTVIAHVRLLSSSIPFSQITAVRNR